MTPLFLQPKFGCEEKIIGLLSVDLGYFNAFTQKLFEMMEGCSLNDAVCVVSVPGDCILPWICFQNLTARPLLFPVSSLGWRPDVLCRRLIWHKKLVNFNLFAKFRNGCWNRQRLGVQMAGGTSVQLVLSSPSLHRNEIQP